MSDKADALSEQGNYAEARKTYEELLEAKRANGGDKRGEGVVAAEARSLPAMMDARRRRDVRQAALRGPHAVSATGRTEG